MSGPPEDGLVTVELLGLPVQLYRLTAQHNDELRREFALLHRSTADDASVPARLQRLSDELKLRFGSFTAESTGALHKAVARRDERIDLVYRVPLEARAAVLELDELLDEADAFCRAGEHLLTLATPPNALAFRKWFLAEFVAQIDGAPPTRWDDYADRPRPAADSSS